MSAGYVAVGWTPHKKLYDRLLVGGIGLYLAIFLGASFALHSEATAETLVIRAFGSLSLMLLHLILAIGPLARLDPRFLPLLYNRRHLGVTMFLCAAVHGGFALFQFHALGVIAPWVNVLGGNPRWDSLAQFPFEVFGVAALFIFFLMAATSHDFWLANLSPPVWKKLHTLVYVAYGLILLHVVLGTVQAEAPPPLVLGLLGGLGGILALHLFAGWRERRRDAALAPPSPEPAWRELGPVATLPEKRGRTFCVGSERIAVFRYDGRVSAISNVCRHQNGPLGEGKIVDGCVVCPWHGYQYRPHDGASPPPFHEKVATYRLKIDGGMLYVDPRPLPPGTAVEPSAIPPEIPAAALSSRQEELYVGYLSPAPPATGRFVRGVVAAILVGVAASAGGLAGLQHGFGDGEFEYGKTRSYEGRLTLAPHPILWLEGAPGRPLLLVGEGKHGADAALAGLDGRRLRLSGSRIHRGGLEMLELAADGIADLGGADLGGGPAPEILDLGQQRLEGEIVDGKCHLGVMKPGSGKNHKACAILCIRGGAPPLFVVKTADGKSLQMLLVGETGQAIGGELVDVVAEPVEIEGKVERRGELLVLSAPRTAIRRLH